MCVEVRRGRPRIGAHPTSMSPGTMKGRLDEEEGTGRPGSLAVPGACGPPVEGPRASPGPGAAGRGEGRAGGPREPSQDAGDARAGPTAGAAGVGRRATDGDAGVAGWAAVAAGPPKGDRTPRGVGRGSGRGPATHGRGGGPTILGPSLSRPLSLLDLFTLSCPPPPPGSAR